MIFSVQFNRLNLSRTSWNQKVFYYRLLVFWFYLLNQIVRIAYNVDGSIHHQNTAS
jgi:hypothetical protein